MELQVAYQRGEMQLLPLYRFDSFPLERREEGYTIGDLKNITWFTRTLGDFPVQDETLCSQTQKPPVPPNEAWVVDRIEMIFKSEIPQVHFVDHQVYNALTQGLVKLVRDRNEVLTWHVDRIMAMPEPFFDYSIRDNEALIDNVTRGIQHNPNYSSVFIPDAPLYFRPESKFHFQYVPCEGLLTSIIELAHWEDKICLESSLLMRLTLRGRLYRPIYESV